MWRTPQGRWIGLAAACSSPLQRWNAVQGTFAAICWMVSHSWCGNAPPKHSTRTHPGHDQHEGYGSKIKKKHKQSEDGFELLAGCPHVNLRAANHSTMRRWICACLIWRHLLAYDGLGAPTLRTWSKTPKAWHSRRIKRPCVPIHLYTAC